MKVRHSKLLFFRDAIESVDFGDLNDTMIKNHTAISDIFRVVQTNGEYKDFRDGYIKQIQDVQLGFSNLLKLKNDQIDLINSTILHEMRDIIEEENKYFADPAHSRYTLEHDKQFATMRISDDAQTLIKSRIGRCIDWRYPGLEIGPGEGTWTRELVAADPLYLVDINGAALEATKSIFNEKYQNRLRCYTNMGKGLHMLPQNQIGFVFSWNTFNYFPLDLIVSYAEEIYDVMCPGGVAMFSYNNAERAHCAAISEEKIMSYIPATLLKNRLTNIGFTSIKTYDVDTSVSWIEFSKPGTRISSRGGQTLGKIISATKVNA